MLMHCGSEIDVQIAIHISSRSSVLSVMCRFLLFALAVSLPVWPQTFPTGDPVMTQTTGRLPLLTPADYEKFAAWAKGHSNIVVIVNLPANLSPAYRLGHNLAYDHY